MATSINLTNNGRIYSSQPLNDWPESLDATFSATNGRMLIRNNEVITHYNYGSVNTLSCRISLQEGQPGIGVIHTVMLIEANNDGLDIYTQVELKGLGEDGGHFQLQSFSQYGGSFFAGNGFPAILPFIIKDENSGKKNHRPKKIYRVIFIGSLNGEFVRGTSPPLNIKSKHPRVRDTVINAVVTQPQSPTSSDGGTNGEYESDDDDDDDNHANNMNDASSSHSASPSTVYGNQTEQTSGASYYQTNESIGYDLALTEDDFDIASWILEDEETPSVSDAIHPHLF